MISKFNAKNELILGWFKYMNIKNLIIISWENLIFPHIIFPNNILFDACNVKFNIECISHWQTRAIDTYSWYGHYSHAKGKNS
jgi:hypothetical protein